MYTYNLIFFMLSCVKKKKKKIIYTYSTTISKLLVSHSLLALSRSLILPCLVPNVYIIWIIYSYNLIISMHILVIIFFIHILLWFPKYLYLIISY